ncbi:MAG TPA: peptidoglycan-binding domain-containing protein [Chthoniobacterales bacterium]|nr:peptidoglycan-binding domain-containing protein [Chthoniobacterales bacterium]
MKKLRLLSLVGITSIALAHAGWAAGHSGGGGGFGGGGFSGGRGGGGGRVGGFGGAPHFAGGMGGFHAPGQTFPGPRAVVGVGTRGGGVGFGMGRYSPYQSAPSSSVRSFAGRSANSPARIVSGNRGGNTSTRATAGANRPDNRSGSVSDRRGQASRPTVARPSNEAALSRQHHIFARENGDQHRDWDRRHAHFFRGHWFCWDGAFWIGLDDGYYPWDFYPYYGYDYYPYDYYTDVEPTYQDYSAQQADPNVSAVQDDLAQLGYYNGPIDGLFGADTRTALTRYQIDRHLQVTGSLTNETMQSLGLPDLASN